MPDYAEVVAAALREVLDERPHLAVEIVGESSRVPAALRTHPRVRLLPGQPGGNALARWTVHLWSPPMLAIGLADETQPFVEASAVGVPTVLSKPIQPAIDAYPSPGPLVEHFDRAEDWIVPVRSLLDDEAKWLSQSREAMRRFDVMHGPAASDVAVNRFLGWALYKREQP
jgi:hypothetical protein